MFFMYRIIGIQLVTGVFLLYLTCFMQEELLDQQWSKLHIDAHNLYILPSPT